MKQIYVALWWTLFGASMLAAKPEAERALSASHIAVITIRESDERTETWSPVEVAIDTSIKGNRFLWHGIISVWSSKGDSPPKKGEQYVAFCSENATHDRGFTLYGDSDEFIRVDAKSKAETIDRITRMVEEQRRDVSRALQAATLNPPPAGEIPAILSLLFDDETQSAAVKRLVGLPSDANAALVMHVYDQRPIPRNLLSPDQPMTFHISPIAACANIQDVVVFVLGLRTQKYFGRIDEASLEKRRSIADAWSYWILVRNPTSEDSSTIRR